MTAPVIPVSCEDVSDHYAGDTVVNRLKFVLPSFGAECWADYVSSRTGAAIKRVTKIIDMERAGATKPEIVDAVDALYRTAKHHSGRDLSAEELEKFRCENGWNEHVEPAPSFDDRPVITSDGRYIVDPEAGTIEPVEDIPADIVAVMPVWEVRESSPTEKASLEFWPRSFDIAPGMESAFEVEQAAAEKLLFELGEILWGAGARDIVIGESPTNRAELIDGGTFFAPDFGAQCAHDM